MRLSARKGRAGKRPACAPAQPVAGRRQSRRHAARVVRRGPADGYAPSSTRGSLAPGAVLAGPLVVTQFDATTLVPPGSRLSVAECGSLLIEIDP